MNSALLVVLAGVLYLAWSNAAVYAGRAQNSQHYRLAKALYSVAAHTGDARAQNSLAGLYAEGLGGERDVVKAAHWLERAAKAGVPTAQFNLAEAYAQGRGVVRDAHKAATLLRPLAEAGDRMAAFALGQLYAAGSENFAPDASQALHWYGLAAQQGHVPAQMAQRVLQLFAQASASKAQEGLEGLQWLRRAAQDDTLRAQIQTQITAQCARTPKAQQPSVCSQELTDLLAKPH